MYYFYHFLFPTQTSPRSSPFPYPPNFIYYLSLKKKKTKLLRQKNGNLMKIKPKAHRTVEYVLYWPTIPRPVWSLVDISNFMSLEKIWFPLFPSRSKLQKLIREVWDFVSASSRYCIFITLNLCRSWVWCHSLSEFMWVSALFSLEDTVSLELFTTSSSYNFSASFSL